MIYASVPGSYIDIDGYASALAYAELLKRRGEVAKSFLAGPLNYSVPDQLRIPELENYKLVASPLDKFIILDLSIPEIIEKHIPETRIIEIVDHHTGFENYWRERMGDKAVIERVGAVATNVFERWEKHLGYEKIPPNIAKLLLAAILDNTLNFNAVITTDRDKIAAEKLAKIVKTSVADFARWYFDAVSQTVTNDLAKSIERDHKDFKIAKLGLKIDCAQITLWRGDAVEYRADEVRRVMDGMAENWLCSAISISDRKNYILTNNTKVGDYLSEVLNLEKSGDWYVSNRLWLRKEIFARLLERES